MDRACPHCKHVSPKDSYICGRCGADLMEGGQLISALSHGDHSSSASVLHKLIPVAVIASSGWLAKAAGSYWILGIGIAAALGYASIRSIYK
ncbi:zinc ribbon domain-containing protein [Paenibacillus thermotolerans]|uniref:zinc ribbon domain-containing protein n=1 Tax=Paenibacillus thermotolerans TaxID=3027807 RepID=UPI002368A07A|nr:MULTISPECIES: zinc ribbon domain-containing protein [unclassified Paenibacillus]